MSQEFEKLNPDEIKRRAAELGEAGEEADGIIQELLSDDSPVSMEPSVKSGKVPTWEEIRALYKKNQVQATANNKMDGLRRLLGWVEKIEKLDPRNK